LAIAYELGTTTAAATTGAAYIELIAVTRRLKVREIGVFSQAATAAAKAQIGRPAAQGITPTTPILGVPQDPADITGVGETAIAWGTPPTAPTSATGIMRQFDFAATAGSGIIFTWPADGELVIPITGVKSIVLWNAGAGTGPLMDFYAVWSE
jgi:hypothetical protein